MAVDDASRLLSPLGEHQAVIAARTLHRLQVIPQGILCSPLTRAQQTARIVMKEIGLSDLTTTEYLTPESDPRQIVQELNKLTSSSVLLVGHLPNIQVLASLLVTGTRHAGIRVSTGTLLEIESTVPLEYGNGVMNWLLSYEQMKEMSAGSTHP